MRSLTALLSGGAAGMTVDLVLFPLDTVKTRLQSPRGFVGSGGFNRIYQGLGPVALGSAPGAAVFFLSYELGNRVLSGCLPSHKQYLAHMASAALGETAACLIRVPVEVVKQRAQANNTKVGSLSVLKATLASEGFFGLYRGYVSTVLREIPFSFIQFPLWECFKTIWSRRRGRYVDSWQAALCGALAGGLAAAVTTPLDVAKTRIMLAEKGSATAKGSIYLALQKVHGERGLTGLFAGVVPRTMWMSIGGFIFLGVYEKTKHELSRIL